LQQLVGGTAGNDHDARLGHLRICPINAPDERRHLILGQTQRESAAGLQNRAQRANESGATANDRYVHSAPPWCHRVRETGAMTATLGLNCFKENYIYFS
jgi:hypothetical protein